MNKFIPDTGFPNYTHQRVCDYCDKDITNYKWHPEVRDYYSRHVCQGDWGPSDCYYHYIEKEFIKIANKHNITTKQLFQVVRDAECASLDIWRDFEKLNLGENDD